jgi:hypothetical protein
MVGGIFRLPELKIDQGEAAQILDAVERVDQHYNWLQFRKASKPIDWTNLVGVLGAIYGPRFADIGRRMREQKPQGPVKTQPMKPTPQPAPEHAPPQGTQQADSMKTARAGGAPDAANGQAYDPSKHKAAAFQALDGLSEQSPSNGDLRLMSFEPGN